MNFKGKGKKEAPQPDTDIVTNSPTYALSVLCMYIQLQRMYVQTVLRILQKKKLSLSVSLRVCILAREKIKIRKNKIEKE